MQCTAHSKRSGQQCKRAATPGRTVCNLHGGKTPQGIAVPQFVHGRYSKALPAHLMERYEQARTDPDLLSFRDELALTDARLLELVERLNTGESSNLWHRLDAQYVELTTLWDAGETAGIGKALELLGRTIRQGASARAQWKEIDEKLAVRRELAESERRQLLDRNQYVTATQAMALVAAMLASVKAHVRDQSALSAIATDLGRLALAEPH